MPVVEDGRLVGIVSRANLLHGLAAGPATAPAPAADDEAVRTRVQTALREDVGGMTEFVNVVVKDGVVDLWGTTDTPDRRRAIQLAAEGTPGVREVRSHLGILSPMARATLWAE